MLLVPVSQPGIYNRKNYCNGKGENSISKGVENYRIHNHSFLSKLYICFFSEPIHIYNVAGAQKVT